MSPLSKEIQDSYTKLTAAVAQVPAKYRKIKRLDGTGGKVNISDLIAYQIGWGRLLIHWYEQGLKGKISKMPGEGFTKWDYIGLAKHFYKKYSGLGQKKQFHTIVEKILEIVEQEYRRGNLNKVGVWAWCTLSSGKQWPLSKWVRVNTASPYKKAEISVRNFLKQI